MLAIIVIYLFGYIAQSRNQSYSVTIPRGVKPGEHFTVLVNGQQMMVRCPEGQRQGDRLVVTAPRQQTSTYIVNVPPNVRFKLNSFIFTM